MYRISSAAPNSPILRIGTIDDFQLQETKLAPQVEQFTKERLSWLPGVKGTAEQHEGGHPSATFFTQPYHRP